MSPIRNKAVFETNEMAFAATKVSFITGEVASGADKSVSVTYGVLLA